MGLREKGRVSEAKKQIVLQLADQIGKHKVIAVAGLRKVRSSQIMEIRKKMRGKVSIFVPKNTLVRKAAETLENTHNNIVKFIESLSGPSLFLLTDMNPYQLKMVLDKNKVRVAVKGGDMASSDIVIPAGNTGLLPGPVISEFSEAKIPTKIEAGSIYVSKDTVVARKGQEISGKLASVLSKLGMKPLEAGLSLLLAYDEGAVLTEEDLIFDLSEYERDFSVAGRNALWLAVEASYITPESAPMILSKAWRQGLSLSLESEYPAVSAMPEILRTAFLTMKALSDQLATRNKDAAPPTYEILPAVVQPLKLEVSPPPVKPKPIPTQKKKAVSPKVEKPVLARSPIIEERKPKLVEEPARTAEDAESARAPEPKKEVPPIVAAEEESRTRTAQKRKPIVARKRKVETRKLTKTKRGRPAKEKAKRGKAKSP